MNPTDSDDRRHMTRALELARRAEGRTRPNPLVGCVVVRDGRVVGEGFHAQAGGPHAEREALASCSEDPRGATMYVTLEPCSHTGRTPPCADAVIGSGVARLVIAQRDPNPQAGGGIERIRAAGIQVETDVCAEETMLLNPAFNTYHMLGRPLVTLKWAASADGCTSCEGGDSRWISDASSRRRVHEMRARADAVLVGIETALRDDAKLTVRDAEVPPGPKLRRMVLDAELRLPPDHPLVVADPETAVVWCTEDASPEREAALANAGATVRRIRRRERGGVSVAELVAALHGEGVQSLLVEGGRRVAGSFLAEGLADRVAVITSPVLIGSGGNALSALVVREPVTRMDRAVRLHHTRVETIGDDVLLEGWLTGHLFGAADQPGACIVGP